MKNAYIYRIEWMHNFNWRMECAPKGIHLTRKDAELAAKSKEYKGLKTRIVRVKV